MKGQKRIKLVLFIIMILLSVFAVGSKSSILVKKNKIDTLQAKGKLVRLHVVANSNSLADQHIKREVRDLMLAHAVDFFKKSRVANQPQKVIKKHKADLKQLINSKLNSLGVKYGVNLNLGRFKFPTRSYGEVTLKSGSYKALRVVLGSGQGENWWCVLFPPLCFVDSRKQVAEKKTNRSSANQNKKQLSVEFKLKCKEVLKENPQMVKSKLKWIKILKTSFPSMEKLIPPPQHREDIK